MADLGGGANLMSGPANLPPPRMKERCLRCDAAWERADAVARHACPRCGEPDWDHELALEFFVGSMEYEVVDERIDPNQILTLELVWPLNRRNRASVRLSHRLKSMYRHQKGDLSVKDGRELLVQFEKPAHGPDSGMWVIHTRRKDLPPP